MSLFIFFSNSVRKRNFSGSRAMYGIPRVWCCALCKIYLYLYSLYCTNTTYVGISLRLSLRSWWQQLLVKAYSLQYPNKAMVTDTFAFRKARSCMQHDLFVLSLTCWKQFLVHAEPKIGNNAKNISSARIYKILKQTKLTTVKLPISFESCNWLNIIR